MPVVIGDLRFCRNVFRLLLYRHGPNDGLILRQIEALETLFSNLYAEVGESENEIWFTAQMLRVLVG